METFTEILLNIASNVVRALCEIWSGTYGHSIINIINALSLLYVGVCIQNLKQYLHATNEWRN